MDSTNYRVQRILLFSYSVGTLVFTRVASRGARNRNVCSQLLAKTKYKGMSMTVSPFRKISTLSQQPDSSHAGVENIHASQSRNELRRSILAPLLLVWYRLPAQRQFAVKLINRLEGGHFFSSTLRLILEKHHDVKIGAYSYGDCCIPGRFPPGVTVGRYVSVARDVIVLSANHPTDRLSMHPFFYHSELGYVEHEGIEYTKLWLGHDAWLGAGSIVTPGCKRIGIGAVVGAGAVVTRDVPNFAIVVGNPARILRYRFPQETQKLILQSQWWGKPIYELIAYLPAMMGCIEEPASLHPLLRLTEPEAP